MTSIHDIAVLQEPQRSEIFVYQLKSQESNFDVERLLACVGSGFRVSEDSQQETVDQAFKEVKDVS